MGVAMDKLSKRFEPIHAAMPQRELKVYISEGLYRELHGELDKCGCGISGFCRMAIIAEIMRRRRERLPTDAEEGRGRE